MIRALIIEDEPHAQRELERLLEATSHDVQVVGLADSVEEGIELIESARDIDLIFMDIQLSDGLSFDIVKQLEVKTPIIFTTAYDEYAIRAFKVNSIDYLLKPVEPEELESALTKFQETSTSRLPLDKLLKAFEGSQEKSYKSRWVAKVGDKIKTYTAEEVAYFFAEDDHVYLVPQNGSPVIIDGSLGQMSENLNPKHFFQISRKFIISYTAIKRVQKYGASQYAIELNPNYGETILVSRGRTKDFIQWLDQ